MYPANTAALLSYLVLCLIGCDMPGRQKSWQIQRNKLPWAKASNAKQGSSSPSRHSPPSSPTRSAKDQLTWEVTVLNIECFLPHCRNYFGRCVINVKRERMKTRKFDIVSSVALYVSASRFFRGFILSDSDTEACWIAYAHMKMSASTPQALH